MFSSHLCGQFPDLRQIPLHFAPSVPQRAQATNKNPNPASIRALRLMDFSRPLDLVPWETPIPEASLRVKNVDCCELGLSPAENGRVPGGSVFDFIGDKKHEGEPMSP